ncbi:MAG: hypothetical protein V4667_05600 [Bacteroidota bacterium]
MKKITLSAIAVLTLAFSITSCKKGENDPALSLKSRKSRVAGEWNVTNYSVNSSNSSTSPNNGPSNSVVNTTNTSTNDESHDGTNLTIISSNSDQNYNFGNNAVVTTTTSSTLSGKIMHHTFVFEKDGTWSAEHHYTTTETITRRNGDEIEVREITSETKSSGVWNFLGKIGEAKNKESMIVSTLSSDNTTTRVSTTTYPNSSVAQSSVSTTKNVSTNTYAVNENANIWKITQLKSKEIMVEGTFDNNYTSTNNSDFAYTYSGTTTTTSSTNTSSGYSKGTVKMTLTAQ